MTSTTRTPARDLTEWYPKTVKPVRSGWYDTKYDGIPGITRRWFDGRYWLYRPGDYEGMCFFGMTGCRDKWRGLKEQAC